MGTEYTDEDRINDFYFFINHYAELYKQYGYSFIAVKDKKVVGVFSSILSAFEEVSKKYEPGTFIIQECSADRSSYEKGVQITRLLTGDLISKI